MLLPIKSLPRLTHGPKPVGSFNIGEFEFEETGKRLGSGTFGVVLRGKHKETGREVALKRIVMHKWAEEGLPLTAVREIKILKALNHPNIIPLLGMSAIQADRTKKDEKDLYYMIFPFCKYDLAGLLENPVIHLTKLDIKLLIKQIVDGVAFLHANQLIHRDIKAANILMTSEGVIKIADFGLARPYDRENPQRKYTGTVVTRWYRAPELLLGERKYDAAVDVWSVGCVFAELFKREPIFMGTSDEDQKAKIWSVCGAPNDENWPGWRDLEEARPIAD
ncbi:MAG: kinase-like domain-containing protein [Piptocephalis tieghemiana]|nr:MAG: kinase-like domain-containing protein [Piptocephalis tieghemiana]